MNARDVAGGVLSGATGLLITRAALDLPLGSLQRPGPGFLPLGLGLALAGLSLVTLVRGLRGHPGAAERPDLVALRAVAATTAGLLFFAVALPWLGYLGTTALLMWTLFAAASGAPRSWPPLVAALVVTTASYLLFETFLRIGLPAGRLWGG